MDSSTIRGAITVAKKAYDTYADYRDRKTSETYEALLKAADSYDPVADSVAQSVRKGQENVAGFYQDSSKQVATLSDQYRKRLEAARAQAEARRAEVVKEASASLKKARKQAPKDAKKLVAQTEKKLNAKLGRKQKPGVGTRVAQVGLVGAVLAAIAAVVYVVLGKRKKAVEAEPPRVEDYPDSRLVYSTQTPTEDDDEAKVASPEEGVTERDEELLDSLEEQLNKHQAED